MKLRDEWTWEAAVIKDNLEMEGIKNPGSNKQVIKALEYEGWDPSEFTPTGQPRLDKVVLAEIQAELGVSQEIAAAVQRYRRITKWSGTYLDAFLGKRTDLQWRTHPSVNTLGAKTGRMSITGPPLQTLPQGPSIRNCILPNTPDECIYTVDYDAQELRLFAHYAQEEGLIKAIENGYDLHTYTASKVYRLPYEAIQKGSTIRQIAKTVRFAQIYGAGPQKMAQSAGLSLDEIHEFLTGSDREFPSIPHFIAAVDLTARRRLTEPEHTAYIWTWGGRYIPTDPDKLYALVNYLIQGSAADLLKDRIVRLDKAGYGDWIMVPVHDELLFSIPRGATAEIDNIVAIMESTTEFSVPLSCSASGPYETWGQKYG